jgi:hypothetical protein
MEINVVEVTKALKAKQCTRVGSRVTCCPAPIGTDRDWLVWLEESDYPAFAEALLADGWEVGGSMIPADVDYTPTGMRFNSFTKGEENIIATASAEFHRRFLAATAMARELNLLDKGARVALFQAVLYGNSHASDLQQANPFDYLHDPITQIPDFADEQEYRS